MGPRNLLILFFSTVAVSLVILIIFFSLFFKNVDLNFNTRLPESAPDIGKQFSATGPTMNPESKADGVVRSTVNVPPEVREAEAASAGKLDGANKKDADAQAAEHDLPPMSDDAALENESPLPMQAEKALPVEKATPETKGSKSAAGSGEHSSRPSGTAVSFPLPSSDAPGAANESAGSSGPPVPGQ